MTTITLSETIVRQDAIARACLDGLRYRAKGGKPFSPRSPARRTHLPKLENHP
jgi:hypothetical protein